MTESHFEEKVNTWASILQRLVTPSIEEMLIIARFSAEKFAVENSSDLHSSYTTALNAIIESRDDQLMTKINKDKESIRQVLHSFVKCYAAMIAHNTETECTSPIVIPSVISWYRGLVGNVFNSMSDPILIDINKVRNRLELRKWINIAVRHEAETIVPIHIFKKPEEVVEKKDEKFEGDKERKPTKHVRFEEQKDVDIGKTVRGDRKDEEEDDEGDDEESSSAAEPPISVMIKKPIPVSEKKVEDSPCAPTSPFNPSIPPPIPLQFETKIPTSVSDKPIEPEKPIEYARDVQTHKEESPTAIPVMSLGEDLQKPI